VSAGIATSNTEFTLGDVNGDGSVDVIKVGTNQVTYFLNNGSGAFGAAQNLALSAGSYLGVGVADINGDGIPDVIGSNLTSGTISVRLGTGGGSFEAAVDYGGATSGGRVTIGDVNGDGMLDVLTAGSGGGGVNVFMGAPEGTFSAADFYNTGTGAIEAQISDFNSDGLADIAVYNQVGTLSILSGQQDGTFGQKVDISVPSTVTFGTLRLGDFDGDGRADLAVGAPLGSRFNIYRSEGDGSFSLYWSQNFTNGPSGGFSIGDYNGDGALDFGYAGYGSQFIRHLQGTQEVSTIQYVNLANRSTALEAIGAVDSILSSISLERASIGASQSRLNVAYQGLSTTTLVSREAATRIVDVDTATEVSSLIRAQILQNAGTSLLAQANQSARLVLDLLNFE
jgi:flagellin-like hook-associated protein FlgL